ncbi:MAG: TetR/AcrR family transcriptional regulator [Gammaproteobacteria bacterium]|nr:TetR/AcrR family transcriptional regulator [Gammaproteobacteria bacterium]MYE84080.1 TetR/AcrR family transcriptional regulator [Gammaproteobacteria bacterium]
MPRAPPSDTLPIRDASGLARSRVVSDKATTATKRRAGGNTRDRIVTTALRLFATEGIDTVTLRRISAESGSANTAAVHYHFRNKAGLIDAILEFLDDRVWRPGRERLAEAIDRDAPLRELLVVGLWPFKMTVFDFPWGAQAQGFSFQLATSNDERLRAALAAVKDPHLDLLKDAVREHLPALPEEVFEQRWLFFRTEAFAGQWVRSKVFRLTQQGDWQWSPQTEREYLIRYLDYVVGGLTAPVSERIPAQLQALGAADNGAPRDRSSVH